MKVAKCATLEEIDSGAWSVFANDAGSAAPYVRERVKALAASTQHSVAGVAERLGEAGLDREALTNLASLVASRAAQVSRTA